MRGQRVDRPARCGQRLIRCGEADAGSQVAGPEPFGNLLVAVPPGQFGRVDAPEVVPVALDQRDAGTEDRIGGGGGSRRPVRRASASTSAASNVLPRPPGARLLLSWPRLT